MLSFWKEKIKTCGCVELNFCLFIIAVSHVIDPCRELESMTTVDQVTTAMSTIAL